mmetsp:Transcript_31278/g.67576  ORF Transcript_31278/g.67576 Transcript_31278/m.67576 type:complete len:214 (+) Transcript_31278:2650-3291(+)
MAAPAIIRLRGRRRRRGSPGTRSTQQCRIISPKLPRPIITPAINLSQPRQCHRVTISRCHRNHETMLQFSPLHPSWRETTVITPATILILRLLLMMLTTMIPLRRQRKYSQLSKPIRTPSIHIPIARRTKRVILCGSNRRDDPIRQRSHNPRGKGSVILVPRAQSSALAESEGEQSSGTGGYEGVMGGGGNGDRGRVDGVEAVSPSLLLVAAA